MLRVSDFWYQYCIASNDGTHTVGIVTMDGADLAWSQDFGSMTEAVVCRTRLYAEMQQGAPLAEVVGVPADTLPADIRMYDDKRVAWCASHS